MWCLWILLVLRRVLRTRKMSKSTQAKGGMAEKKAKETGPKFTCFYCGQVGH